MEMAFSEKFEASGICLPILQITLATPPHHNHSTPPYNNEGRFVIEWHSPAVASASAVASAKMTACPLMRSPPSQREGFDASRPAAEGICEVAVIVLIGVLSLCRSCSYRTSAAFLTESSVAAPHSIALQRRPHFLQPIAHIPRPQHNPFFAAPFHRLPAISIDPTAYRWMSARQSAILASRSRT